MRKVESVTMKNTPAPEDANSIEKPTGNNNNSASIVSLVAKPSPPRTLNDLEEAGRIRLTVHFARHHRNGAGMPVKQMSAKITNNTKARSSSTVSVPRMKASDGNTDTGDNFEDVISATAGLAQKELDTGYGEIAIPCNWFEGGSKTFERTGSFSPYYDDSLFTMTISWMLSNNHAPESRKPVVELHSTDAFHWDQQQ